MELSLSFRMKYYSTYLQMEVKSYVGCTINISYSIRSIMNEKEIDPRAMILSVKCVPNSMNSIPSCMQMPKCFVKTLEQFV